MKIIYNKHFLLIYDYVERRCGQWLKIDTVYLVYKLVSGFPFHEQLVGCYSTEEKAEEEKVKYETARIQEIEVE